MTPERRAQIETLLAGVGHYAAHVEVWHDEHGAEHVDRMAITARAASGSEWIILHYDPFDGLRAEDFDFIAEAPAIIRQLLAEIDQ